MKIVALLLILVVAGVMAFKLSGRQAPLQGMARVAAAAPPALVSRARPAAAFAPAPTMRLLAAGWRDILPPTRLSLPGSARAWFAVYDDGKGRLVTAFLETSDQWEWQPGHHEPFPVLRQRQYEHKGRTLYESLYALPAESDPFPVAGAPACLVYRAKYLPFFRSMQMIAEYREPLPADGLLRAGDDADALNALQERGRAACDVLFPGREAARGLAEGMEALSAAGGAYSRERLSRWAGEVRRPKDL